MMFQQAVNEILHPFFRQDMIITEHARIAWLELTGQDVHIKWIGHRLSEMEIEVRRLVDRRIWLLRDAETYRWMPRAKILKEYEEQHRIAKLSREVLLSIDE